MRPFIARWSRTRVARCGRDMKRIAFVYVFTAASTVAPSALAQSSDAPDATSASPATDPQSPDALPAVEIDAPRPATPAPTYYLASQSVRAPRPPRPELPRNVVAWQPLSLIFASWDLEYERVLERHVSVYAATSFVFAAHDPYRGPADFWVYGFAGDIGARFYPWGNAPDGFFLQPHLGLMTFNDQYNTRSQGLGFRTGLLPGYAVVIARRVDISFGTGFEYGRFTRGGYTRDWVGVTVRLALGVVF